MTAVWFEDLISFGSVVVVDLALAGDNAIVVGLIAAGVPIEQRRQVLLLGVVLAIICRVAFAVIAVQLLALVGLMLAGGLLLLWVAWKMWRDFRPILATAGPGKTSETRLVLRSRGAAILHIGIADVSMSLDNVLAVAGTARQNTLVLVFGLVLSIALMGLAAGYVARFLASHAWVNYLGVAIVTFVALSMIYEGGNQVLAAVRSAYVY